MAFNKVEKIDDLVPVRNVLMSVFDKSKIEVLVEGLLETCPGVRFYSTGGTYKRLKEILGNKSDKCLVSVSDYTGQPEMQGGLVKTLDFKIYLGLLGEKYNEAHQADLARTDAVAFDMVVANLYPFTRVTADKSVSPETARSNIDIGGPCMIRAAAKNYIRVASVTDSSDYARLVEELRKNNGCLSLDTRFFLMKEAFVHTAEYDTAISKYFVEIQEGLIASVYDC